MTEKGWRTPLRVPMPALALSSSGPSAGTDLVALMNPEPDAPHPDFVARAAIWRDQAAGLISVHEARRRSENVGREATAREQRKAGPPRPRHTRPSPNDSRQYAREMSTTAARDDRLTPNAKAFLQVLRARCGKGRETTITKGTAGNIMARSPRTIRRYLVDLVRFGYVELQTRCNARGLHLGLTVKLTSLVMPFFEEARGLAKWLAETPGALFRPFEAVFDPRKQGVTSLSSKNQSQSIPSSATLGNAGTSRWAAREKLMKRMGASSAPPA